MPIVAESKLSKYENQVDQQPEQSPQSQQNFLQQNSIPIDYAQELINKATYRVANELVPKVADEAANRAVSSFIQSNNLSSNQNGLKIVDRNGVVVSQTEYERIIKDARDRAGSSPANTISLGARIENAISQKLDDTFVQNFVGRLFTGGTPSVEPKKPHSGIIGTLLDIADTKMGYAFGEKIGDKATDLVKMFGTERIGAMMDAYSGKTSPGQPQQQQLTPEQQQKQAETILMSLDSTNIEDMNKFMQMTGINNLYDAQKLLLSEQDKIIQSRGFARPRSQSQSQSQEQEQASNRTPSRAKNKQNDMNRDLIERYESSDQQYQQDFNQPNDFFGGNTNSSLGFETGISSQTNEEKILSLNPDDPTSLHQYSSMRNLVNLDAITIKKMLIQEQKNLLSKASTTPQITSQPNTISSPIRDAEVIENRGISPDEDQSQLKGGSPSNELVVQKPKQPSEQQSIQEQQVQPEHQVSSEQQTAEQQTAEQTNDASNDLTLMNTIMSVLDKLDKKIDYLESEITTMKKSGQSNSEQRVIIKNVNVDDVINKSPRIANLNDVTKYPNTQEDKETESNNAPVDSDNISEENKTETVTSEPVNNIQVESSSKGEIDWWGERGKIVQNLKEDEKSDEPTIKSDHHRKFKISKK